MAIASSRRDAVDAGLGCYFVDAHYFVEAYLDVVSWGRDTGNAARSSLYFEANALQHYDSLVWAGSGNFTNNTIWVWSNVETKSQRRDFPKGGVYCTGATGCCYCLCNGNDWWWDRNGGKFTGRVIGDVNTTRIGISCQYLTLHSGDGFYNLPDNLRVLPPVGLSVSWPSIMSGSVSASITSWSKNTNIGGTPTTYGGASYWNWAIDLLDENGNMVAHKTYNTGETKSCSFGSANSGWYTASALAGSSGAIGSPYTVQAGKKYKLRVYAQNNMNQRLTADSGWFISTPPKPTVSITSVIYNPTTKKSELCFDWSLAQSGLYPEVLTYTATLPDGTVVASGTIKTISDGAASSGSVCDVVVPTGDRVTITVTNTAGTGSSALTSTGSASAYSPVANAAFLGFEWDELRRTCTIRAEAPGAANCRIEAGYSANNYNIGNKLTTGEVGTLVVRDLQHGNGETMYLQAVPEASNGYQFKNEIAKISVPIPNPILGIRTPACESGEEKEYIVDIVEKKANCSVTTRWQVGDRVVTKSECPPVLKHYSFYDWKSDFKIVNGVIQQGSYIKFKMVYVPSSNVAIKSYIEASFLTKTISSSIIQTAQGEARVNEYTYIMSKDYPIYAWTSNYAVDGKVDAGRYLKQLIRITGTYGSSYTGVLIDVYYGLNEDSTRLNDVTITTNLTTTATTGSHFFVKNGSKWAEVQPDEFASRSGMPTAEEIIGGMPQYAISKPPLRGRINYKAHSTTQDGNTVWFDVDPVYKSSQPVVTGDPISTINGATANGSNGYGGAGFADDGSLWVSAGDTVNLRSPNQRGISFNGLPVAGFKTTSPYSPTVKYCRLNLHNGLWEEWESWETPTTDS